MTNLALIDKDDLKEAVQSAILELFSDKKLRSERGQATTVQGFLTVPKAADFLGVSVPTIRKWYQGNNPILRSHKQGKMVFFDPEELREDIKRVPQLAKKYIADLKRA